MHAFRARLCFVQLGTDRDVFLLDTLVPGVEAAVARGVCSPTRRAPSSSTRPQGDLQFLAEAGVRVRGLFDTHRAATLLGWPKVGLADLRGRAARGGAAQRAPAVGLLHPPAAPGDAATTSPTTCATCASSAGRCASAWRQADILEEVELDCERLCDEAAARPDVAP